MERIGEIDGDQDNKAWRKPRKFRTAVYEKKTQEPDWSYRMSHTFDIDDDMLLKLQQDSLCVSVYGKQDGFDKYFKNAIVKNEFPTVAKEASNPFAPAANDDRDNKLQQNSAQMKEMQR